MGWFKLSPRQKESEGNKSAFLRRSVRENTIRKASSLPSSPTETQPPFPIQRKHSVGSCVKFGGSPQPLPRPDEVIIEKKETFSPTGSGNGNSKKETRITKFKTSVESASREVQRQKSMVVSDEKETSLIIFTLRELELSTKNFAPERLLGTGGFGSVYKGTVRHPKTNQTVSAAVKVLQLNGFQGEMEWLTEVAYLGHLRHPNLAKLVGHCAEGNRRLLVYKFAQNGSLDKALFGAKVPLPWMTRIKIVIGAARGLHFLHEENGHHQIIYRDFKSSNILLDKYFEAMLSDFGLARSGPEGDASHVTTRVVGTMGYASPEYISTGHLTVKSDVWAFGVVLLEIMTGRMAIDMTRPLGERNLVDWAQPYSSQPEKLYKIMDPSLSGEYSVRGAQKLATVAWKCLMKDPKQRPSMAQVLTWLEPLPEMKAMAGISGDLLTVPYLKERNELFRSKSAKT